MLPEGGAGRNLWRIARMRGDLDGRLQMVRWWRADSKRLLRAHCEAGRRARFRVIKLLMAKQQRYASSSEIARIEPIPSEPE